MKSSSPCYLVHIEGRKEMKTNIWHRALQRALLARLDDAMEVRIDIYAGERFLRSLHYGRRQWKSRRRKPGSTASVSR